MVLNSYICRFCFFQGSNKSSRKNRFPSIISWISILHHILFMIILQPWFYWFIIKFTSFIHSHFCFVLQLDSSNCFLKSISICNTFLPFKGANHVYLLKTSITHNKKWNPLLNLLTNCISARPGAEISSSKE